MTASGGTGSLCRPVFFKKLTSINDDLIFGSTKVIYSLLLFTKQFAVNFATFWFFRKLARYILCEVQRLSKIQSAIKPHGFAQITCTSNCLLYWHVFFWGQNVNTWNLPSQKFPIIWCFLVFNFTIWYYLRRTVSKVEVKKNGRQRDIEEAKKEWSSEQKSLNFIFQQSFESRFILH